MPQLPIRHPSTVLIAGPTGSGKTQFLAQLLTTKYCIVPSPDRIIWVYGEWQAAYDELTARLGSRILFTKDCDTEQIYESLDPQVRNLLVLDDQMGSDAVGQGSGSSIAKFFTQGSHHRNLTVVYIVQNLFNKDRVMRTVSLNSHYIFLFKNPRDNSQIRTFASQMFPNNSRFLVDAFRDATSESYGYLLADCHKDTPEVLRARTNVMSKTPVVYVPLK